MKKVGIVTIIDYYNYGNRLQNYALSYLLNERFKCHAVTLEGYSNKRISGSVIGWIKEQILLCFCRFSGLANNRINPKVVRWFNFSEWTKQWIPHRKYYECESLPKDLNSKFDLFVTGSDQVWNCRIKNFRKDDYFLTFAENGKKNSVAASFGVEEIPAAYTKYYYQHLSQFKNISVREDSGAQIIKNLIGKEVPVLIDPVLMLSPEEWKTVEKKTRIDTSQKYVLKYYLGEKNNEIEKWAEKNGFAVYDLMDTTKSELYSAGPGEFLYLVRNADLVCSDSFHCIAFSILFSVPFIVYRRQGSENYMLSRLESLLNKFEYEDRWNDLLPEDQYLKCDFNSFKRKINIEKKEFSDYIISILEGKSNLSLFT